MDATIQPQLTSIQIAQHTNIDKQMDSILLIANLLENGKRNTGQLVAATGLARTTVIKYRDQALKLLHNENKALNTEAMRHMEIGRLNYWIDWLQVRIERETDKDHQVKLLGRLDNMQGRLHSISGLNTTVNVNYEEKKRITFVMSQDSGTTVPVQAEPIEGVLIDSPAIKP